MASLRSQRKRNQVVVVNSVVAVVRCFVIVSIQWNEMKLILGENNSLGSF